MTNPDPTPGKPNSRNLIGMIALLVFLIIYGGLIGMLHDWLGDMHVLVATVFYAVAGLAWLWPAKWLVGWMLKPGIEQ